MIPLQSYHDEERLAGYYPATCCRAHAASDEWIQRFKPVVVLFLVLPKPRQHERPNLIRVGPHCLSSYWLAWEHTQVACAQLAADCHSTVLPSCSPYTYRPTNCKRKSCTPAFASSPSKSRVPNPSVLQFLLTSKSTFSEVSRFPNTAVFQFQACDLSFAGGAHFRWLVEQRSPLAAQPYRLPRRAEAQRDWGGVDAPE